MNDKLNRRLFLLWILFAVIAVTATLAAFFLPRSSLHIFSLILGPVVFTVAVLISWAFRIGAHGRWRWLPLLAFIIPLVLMFVLVYPGDPMKPLMYLAPFVATLWLIWLTFTRTQSWSRRCVGAIVVILAGWGIASAIRIDETDAEIVPEIRLAWQPTKKQLFERDLASRQSVEKPTISDAVIVGPGDWAEFRGPKRDSVVNEQIRTDWAANPPKLIWKHLVGAGWGSFSIVGDRAFTQEQRGDAEAVVCYHAPTGIELWEHRVPARFFEGIAGEGPRATPTIHDGKLYAFGATGKLVCVDEATGKEIWLRDVTVDVGATAPQWGFSSSPLIIDGKAIVFSAAPNDKAVVAYNAATGELAWARGKGQHGYSSAQRYTLGDLTCILMVSDYGLEAFRLDGTPCGEFVWTLKGQNRVAQPAILEGDSILLGTSVGGVQGAKRLKVSSGPEGLKFEEVWSSRSPKPYFNDGVVFEKHYYGFDDRNFVCVDLKNGKVKWNAGSGYGFGQMLLLPAQKKLLIQAENGSVVLLDADAEEQNVVGKFPALKEKTWNHPVVCRGRLYVRNNLEAACYDLTPTK